LEEWIQVLHLVPEFHILLVLPLLKPKTDGTLYPPVVDIRFDCLEFAGTGGSEGAASGGFPQQAGGCPG
jgi:hypothetical protein